MVLQQEQDKIIIIPRHQVIKACIRSSLSSARHRIAVIGCLHGDPTNHSPDQNHILHCGQ